MSEHIRALIGAGILPAFIASAFGAPEHLQLVLFAFARYMGRTLDATRMTANPRRELSGKVMECQRTDQ